MPLLYRQKGGTVYSVKNLINLSIKPINYLQVLKVSCKTAFL
jgi:hypothetical protein